MIKTTRSVILLALLVLFAAPLFAGSVTVTWDPNTEPDVTGYTVFYGTQSGVYQFTQSAGSATTSTVDNLTPGQTYYFAVQAVSLNGLTSPLSQEVSTTIPAIPTAPPVPTPPPAPCSIALAAVASATATTASTLAFQATATAANCGQALAYEWDFGDGSTHGTGSQTSHAYLSAGVFGWTLTARADATTATRTGTVSVTSADTCVPSTHLVAASTAVTPDAFWQTTGVTVRAGDRLTITPPNATWTKGGQAWTAAGNPADVTNGPNCALSGAPRMALVGRIGSSGAPFLVGAGYQNTAATTGVLYLAPNDDWYLMWGNAGSLGVSVCSGSAPTSACTLGPTANGPTTGAEGDLLGFSASTSSPGCVGTTTYTWDFGDGSGTSAEQHPTHSYSRSGTFTWTLTVRNGSTSATRNGSVAISGSGGGTETTATVVAAPGGGQLDGMWQPTGVTVTAGTPLTITAAPGSAWSKGGRAWTAAGNAGDPTTGPNCPMSGAPRMALIGRIGPAGAPFLVGTELSATASTSGELYLAPNDDWYLLWDNAGSLSVSIGSGSAGQACSVQATATAPSSSALGSQVAFTSAASASGCAGTVTYDWNFGDGSAHVSEASPLHLYQVAGTYTWSVTMDAGTAGATRSGTISVGDEATGFGGAPSTTLTASVAGAPPMYSMWQDTGVTVAAGDTLTISSNGSAWTHEGQPIGADGQPGTTVLGPNTPLSGAPLMALIGRLGPTGTPFLVGSNYQATSVASGALYLAPNDNWYTLWDNGGTLAVSISTGAQAGCAVQATGSAPASVAAGSTVTFSGAATSTCGGAVSYDWDFGDGTAHTTQQNPDHVFAQPGLYTWTLTTRDGSAGTTRSGSIMVGSGGPCTPASATVVSAPSGGGLVGMWQPTGIRVTAGMPVTITAPGAWANGGINYTADGDRGQTTWGPNSPLPGGAVMALIGRVGESGASFKVGASLSFTPASSGMLYLAPNDNWYTLWDNSGSLTATVCR